MYEATFRIQHGSPYAEFTRDGGVCMELWCNEHCDFIRLTGPDHDRSLGSIEEEVGVRASVERGGETVLITDTCLLMHMEDRIETHLERRGCLSLPPIQYARGRVTLRVLAPEERQLTDLFNDLNERFSITVDTKGAVEASTPRAPLLLVDSALPDFSPRQREALGIAYDDGYYELPRETTTNELATKVDVERRTFEEHLRRAERKMVVSFLEHLLTDTCTP